MKRDRQPPAAFIFATLDCHSRPVTAMGTTRSSAHREQGHGPRGRLHLCSDSPATIPRRPALRGQLRPVPDRRVTLQFPQVKKRLAVSVIDPRGCP